MTRIVNNSKRPNNIKNVKKHFPEAGTAAKLSTGLKSAKAGPTFPKDVATELMADNKGRSKSFKMITITKEPKKNNIK